MSNVAWVDLETTGLDPLTECVVEVGITVTDPGPIWQPIASASWICHVPNVYWDYAASVVQEMHEANGLKSLSLDASFTPEQHSDRILSFLKEHDALGSPMYGATVHFDRAFLVKFLPEVEKAFHYRNFDVSTLKQYAIAMNGDADWWMDREIHRALPDLADSIANLIHFRNIFPGR